MHTGVEWFDLLQQRIRQFLAGAFRDGRNVVDRLVRIQLGALAARLSNGIHDLGFQAKETQLEYLEQAAGSCAYDDDIGGDHELSPGKFGRALSRQSTTPAIVENIARWAGSHRRSGDIVAPQAMLLQCQSPCRSGPQAATTNAYSQSQ